jgi:hypothetical protein
LTNKEGGTERKTALTIRLKFRTIEEERGRETAFPALGKYGGMDTNGKDHGGKGVLGARFLGDVSAQYPGDLGPLL